MIITIKGLPPLAPVTILLEREKVRERWRDDGDACGLDLSQNECLRVNSVIVREKTGGTRVKDQER